MVKKNDGFGHEQPYEGKTNDWITPKWIIDAFDSLANWNAGGKFFDLDPCASVTQPWECASEKYTIADDGLSKPWYGSVWCNPPYGPYTKHWITKLAGHNDGVALIFARVENKLWQNVVFPTGNGFLFIKRRVQFSFPNGITPTSSSGAPSALVTFGRKCRDALIELVKQDKIPGVFLTKENI